MVEEEIFRIVSPFFSSQWRYDMAADMVFLPTLQQIEEEWRDFLRPQSRTKVLIEANLEGLLEGD